MRLAIKEQKKKLDDEFERLKKQADQLIQQQNQLNEQQRQINEAVQKLANRQAEVRGALSQLTNLDGDKPDQKQQFKKKKK